MYYYISGSLVHTSPGIAVIDNNGIGYKLTVSTKTLSKLPNAGENAKLFTYLVTREDGNELFGFFDIEECSTFQMLITVSGVGPKAAMAILSELTPEKFAMCVISDDPKAISAAHGVGIKTSQKIILELQDKIKKNGIVRSSGKTNLSPNIDEGTFFAAVDALVVLGYSRNEAFEALDGIDKATILEDMIRIGLKKLMR